MSSGGDDGRRVVNPTSLYRWAIYSGRALAYVLAQTHHLAECILWGTMRV